MRLPQHLAAIINEKAAHETVNIAIQDDNCRSHVYAFPIRHSNHESPKSKASTSLPSSENETRHETKTVLRSRSWTDICCPPVPRPETTPLLNGNSHDSIPGKEDTTTEETSFRPIQQQASDGILFEFSNFLSSYGVAHDLFCRCLFSSDSKTENKASKPRRRKLKKVPTTSFSRERLPISIAIPPQKA